MRRIWRALRPEDTYHLLYLGLATALLAAAADVPLGPLLAVHAAIAAIILLGAPAALRWPWPPLRALRDLYHLPAGVFYYRETAALHRALWGERHFDDAIVALDQRLFGGQPSLEFAHLVPRPGFSELMHFAYLSYYPLALAGALALWCCRDRDVYPRAVHTVVFTMLVCYALFVVFPVIGPPFHWPALHHAGLEGTLGRQALSLLLVLDEPTGAFPSSHVAVTVALLAAFWRDLRPAFWITLLPAALLIVSTVYVRAHYASDAIAGLFVGLACAALAERLRLPITRALGLRAPPYEA